MKMNHPTYDTGLLLAGLCLALVLAALAPAAAQVPPYLYPAVIGTTQAQVLPQNDRRRRVIFINPNATATIAFCPAGPARNTGAAVACAVNGAGSITVLPRSSFVIDGGTLEGPPLQMGSAWNGVADTPSSNFTALEFE